MARLVITIDGPAASGKSTVARLLAEKLNAKFLDTGAMYRAATVAAMKAGVDLTSQHQVLEVLNNTEFEFISSKSGTRVRMDGVEVTDQLRDPRVTAGTRYVAGFETVRRRMVTLQRKFAQINGRVVTEGRDQGTVAFPDADAKFFLTANLDERAKRRQAEINAKGLGQTAEQVSGAILKRDKTDESRTVGPLKPAEDAVTVDTTDLTPEQVVEKMLDCVKARLGEDNGGEKESSPGGPESR